MESAHCVWSGVGTGSAARAHLIGTAAVAIGLSCWATGVVTAWSGARERGETNKQHAKTQDQTQTCKAPGTTHERTTRGVRIECYMCMYSRFLVGAASTEQCEGGAGCRLGRHSGVRSAPLVVPRSPAAASSRPRCCRRRRHAGTRRAGNSRRPRWSPRDEPRGPQQRDVDAGGVQGVPEQDKAV